MVGDVVQVQNQHGPHAKKWDLSGVVVEVVGYDAYLVKLDGTGRASKLNRQFLKPIKTFQSMLVGQDTGNAMRDQREIGKSIVSVERPKDIVNDVASGLPVSDKIDCINNSGCPVANSRLGAELRASLGEHQVVTGRAESAVEDGSVFPAASVQKTVTVQTGKTGQGQERLGEKQDGGQIDVSTECSVVSRPRRPIRAPDRFQAGDPSDRAFRRRK